jgi:hypothetical protein
MVRTAAEPFGPGRRNPEPSKARWTLRDTLAGLLLFLATACVVLWQNAHVAILWDTSYVLDSAMRFALGQMPYRDFPFVHAPITFLIQAAIIRFTGRVFFHHVIYVAIVGGLATLLTWRIALVSLRGYVARAWIVALLLAAPLAVVGIYSIIPIPEYDGDCAFWILVALWLLQRAGANQDELGCPTLAASLFLRLGWGPAFVWMRGFAAGVALCLPLFTKQNMGLPFLLASVAAVLVVLAFAVVRRGQVPPETPDARTFLSILAGVGAALSAAALALHWTAGVRNYIDWTITFAGERRLPRLDLMLAVFRDPELLWTLPCAFAGLALLWLHHPSNSRVPHPRRASVLAPRVGAYLPWTQFAAFALLAAPFLFALASLLIYDDADSRGDSLLALWPLLLLLAAAMAIANLSSLRRTPSIRALFPLIVLAAILGTFMSQELWGSTYAIWPLLALLIAESLAFLAPLTDRASSRGFVPALAALVSITLFVCGGFYTASEERISYVNLPDGPVEHSAFPALAGIATPGPYLPEFDELLRYAAANIPQDDGVILIPGEDPFFFASGRVPRFPVLLFDPTTDPYSPAQTAALAQSNNIRWLIVKRDLQIKIDATPDRAATMQALMSEFTLAAHLRGYDVYRR